MVKRKFVKHIYLFYEIAVWEHLLTSRQLWQKVPLQDVCTIKLVSSNSSKQMAQDRQCSAMDGKLAEGVDSQLIGMAGLLELSVVKDQSHIWSVCIEFGSGSFVLDWLVTDEESQTWASSFTIESGNAEVDEFVVNVDWLWGGNTGSKGGCDNSGRLLLQSLDCGVTSDSVVLVDVVFGCGEELLGQKVSMFAKTLDFEELVCLVAMLSLVAKLELTVGSFPKLSDGELSSEFGGTAIWKA